jgi:hypothetical protein
MQNGGLEIPYYQQFVEFPIHFFTPGKVTVEAK